VMTFYTPFQKHAAEWTMSLNIPETVYGNIVPGKENNEPPFLFIQSRICGIRLYRFEGSVLDKPSWKSLNEQHFQEMPVSTHIGFCKMVYHESPTVGPLLLFPDQQESIWILNKRHIGNISKQPVPQIEAKSTVMFMMVCNSQCPEEGTFVLYGLEDGTLKASSISAKHGGEKEEADMEAKAWDDEMVLNQCGNSSSDRNIVGEVEDDLVTPLCGVFEKEKNLIVIGTNTKMLYILKSGHRQLKFEGKKRLINTGINCMELHSSAKLMVTGGWDGVIRLFGLPTLNQIIAINYHKTAITSLYFLDKVDKNFPSFKKGKDDYEEPPEKLDRKKCPLVDLNEDKPLPRPFFLLVGATNGIVSCWNLYPSVH
jgi:WD40 repeat protein